MIIRYGNITHILTILFALSTVVGLVFLLKNKSDKVKKIVILSILFFNLFQHVFKCIVWPQYYGKGFGEINTAYNMCAFLIIVSPFIFLTKVKVLKDFIFYIGTTAGIIAISVPYWFIGQTIFTFEYLRFYICHLSLFVGSMLPVLLGLHRISLKNTWKIAFIALGALLIVLANGLIFSFINHPNDLSSALNSFYSKNPVWALHPTSGFEGVTKVIELFTPKIFLGGDDKNYVPILWYIIPMYILITIPSLLVCLLFELVIYKKMDNKSINQNS